MWKEKFNDSQKQALEKAKDYISQKMHPVLSGILQQFNDYLILESLVKRDPQAQTNQELSKKSYEFLEGLNDVVKSNLGEEKLGYKIIDIAMSFGHRMFESHLPTNPRAMVHYAHALKNIDIATGDILEELVYAGHLPFKNSSDYSFRFSKN